MSADLPSLPARIAGLGRVMQLAFVPKDIEAATDFWVRQMGVGPFFVLPHVRLENVRYRGTPAEIDFSIRLAYWGDMQIELIEQHNTAPSIYREENASSGLHHVCLLVEHIAPARALCAGLGLTIAQEGLVPGGGAAIYVETGGGPGTLVEILQPAQGGLAFFDMMQSAARQWDGTDPVRMLG